jgi:hypothetical protein
MNDDDNLVCGVAFSESGFDLDRQNLRCKRKSRLQEGEDVEYRARVVFGQGAAGWVVRAPQDYGRSVNG